MTPSHGKTTTVTRWHSTKGPSADVTASDSAPYFIILTLLCALSVVSAIKDPLAFAEIFGAM